MLYSLQDSLGCEGQKPNSQWHQHKGALLAYGTEKLKASVKARSSSSKKKKKCHHPGSSCAQSLYVVSSLGSKWRPGSPGHSPPKTGSCSHTPESPHTPLEGRERGRESFLATFNTS